MLGWSTIVNFMWTSSINRNFGVATLNGPGFCEFPRLNLIEVQQIFLRAVQLVLHGGSETYQQLLPLLLHQQRSVCVLCGLFTIYGCTSLVVETKTLLDWRIDFTAIQLLHGEYASWFYVSFSLKKSWSNK